ncbi:hypothetical protein GWI33_020228 [Rhynchophorus ferrugineus]|uniref:Uncharacterized protein n=1 Tax=Rhynchophorus ferrugineus TaxID=354439 RepID=A0A834M3M0_RHYFE|nr:hypothetical protein GWI33_020228 [Rhynchophorus ferrugineus]
MKLLLNQTEEFKCQESGGRTTDNYLWQKSSESSNFIKRMQFISDRNLTLKYIKIPVDCASLQTSETRFVLMTISRDIGSASGRNRRRSADTCEQAEDARARHIRSAHFYRVVCPTHT